MIWDNISNDRERGGITEAMYDAFEQLIPSCGICGGNGSTALNHFCFSCEQEEWGNSEIHEEALCDHCGENS